ncbi:hypothetical protein BC832DRAFT_433011 [Gaertneriomyces semiglobifer]|nr:hypothetical protein BC832DRAFT_433011 [Gaertneriomyces semiglobifer]
MSPHRSSSNIHLREISPVRTEAGQDHDDDNDDTTSVRSTATSRALQANRPPPLTKSQKISSIQSIFTEHQKIAYVGLCYLSVVHLKGKDVKSMKKCNESFKIWSEKFMERLFLYLDISTEERSMFQKLAEHGLKPADLAKSIVDDARRAAQVTKDRQTMRQKAEEEALEQGVPFDPSMFEQDGDDAEPTDIRYTILTHLFIICIADGFYDARSRAVLRGVAEYLEVPWLDVVKLESTVAAQLRIYEDSEEVRGRQDLVGKRNTADQRQRWIFTGLATLAGGAVIGLTAGLAAPLIAGGIGVALGTFGVSGVSAALSTTGALALITTGGVLTGGGMGGFKMLKRTKGISQFEFLSLTEGLRQIEENKEKRRTERRRKRRREARQALQDKMDKQRADADTDGKAPEASNDSLETPQANTPVPEEEELRPYEPVTAEKLDRVGDWVSISADQRRELDKVTGTAPGRPVAIPKRVPPPVPNRPSEAELAVVTERVSLRATPTTLAVNTELSVPSANDQHSANSIGSSLPYSGDELTSQDWDLDGVGISSNAGSGTLHDLGTKDVGESSTLLWDSQQSETDLEGDMKLRRRFTSSFLNDDVVIDEDTAAALFDDLQSTIAGDVPRDDDEGFRFKEYTDTKAKQTNVLITVAGWIAYGPDDHTLPFSVLEPELYGDQYALIWETDALQELGGALKLLVGEVASFVIQQGLQATVLSALMLGLAGPIWAMKLGYLVDNPWGVGLSKAIKAGKVLADTLMQGVQENRPVTLIGFSLGARVIYHCLLELAARGVYGLVEEAYLLGCPVMAQKKEWQQISSVVSRRVVNGYCSNDMVLGVLYRASVAVWSNVAGLRPVEDVDKIENVCLDGVIEGHLDYRLLMPKVLEKLGFHITRDYFDDEDEEEEKERLEMEEEKKREKEEQLREQEEQLKKKQAEYEEKLQKQKEEQERKQQSLAEKEAERKRKEVERAADPSRPVTPPSRLSWFSRRSSSRSLLSLASAQDNEKAKVAEVMDEYWTPREIKSTLPPLVIMTEEDDAVITPREIQSTLPPLVIRTESLREEPLSTTSSDMPLSSSPVTREDAEVAQAQQAVEVAEKDLAKAKREFEEAQASVSAAAAAATASAVTRLRLNLEASGEDLEKVLTAAQRDGPIYGAGAGDLLDSAGYTHEMNESYESPNMATVDTSLEPSPTKSEPESSHAPSPLYVDSPVPAVAVEFTSPEVGNIWTTDTANSHHSEPRSSEGTSSLPLSSENTPVDDQHVWANKPNGLTLDIPSETSQQLRSAGVHSLTSGSSDEFVDAQENPWMG